MISRVRDLAASDPGTLNVIVRLLAKANANQATAIRTGLGQVGLTAVKTDRPYANQVQEAIATGSGCQGAGSCQTARAGARAGCAGLGSSRLSIGDAVKAIDQVEGETEKGRQAVITGDQIYLNEVVKTGSSGKAEFLFKDRTNLAVGPVATIWLEKFVYDPSGGGSGNIVLWWDTEAQDVRRQFTGPVPSR